MRDRDPKTRILGLDFGLRRVGAALSDPRRLIATPLEVYQRRDPVQDAKHYRQIIAEHDVDRIVLGFPYHSSGAPGTLARQVEAWGRWLAEATELPVLFYDERYTTVDAEDAMRAAGLKAKEIRAKVDMLAARILLQNYLDAGCPESTFRTTADPIDEIDTTDPPATNSQGLT